MAWVQVKVPANEQSKEGISNFLFEQNATGCLEGDDFIVGYFSETDASEQFVAWLTHYLDELLLMGIHADPVQIEIKHFADEEWDLTWRKEFKSLQITPGFVVTPPWIKYQKQADETVIQIHPKMAFGTGSHETTKFMIMLMEKYCRPGKSVLDAGTGTGILAIVAKYLGAGQINAFDNDPVAIECAQENVNLNLCSESINLRCTAIDSFLDPLLKFDYILANIQKSVILELSEIVLQLLNTNGLFFISGILVEQENELDSAMKKHGLQFVDRQAGSEWIAYVYRKR